MHYRVPHSHVGMLCHACPLRVCVPRRYVWASLLPIVGGCSLSALKEVSFSWGGFNNAMISNLGMVLRNIYSKKSLNDYKVRGQLVAPLVVLGGYLICSSSQLACGSECSAKLAGVSEWMGERIITLVGHPPVFSERACAARGQRLDCRSQHRLLSVPGPQQLACAW